MGGTLHPQPKIRVGGTLNFQQDKVGWHRKSPAENRRMADRETVSIVEYLDRRYRAQPVSRPISPEASNGFRAGPADSGPVLRR